jgi:hypothetical protein
MLTKQWQMGEFIGDDAASPMLARVCIDTFSIDRLQRAEAPMEALDPTQPLEAQVECRPVPVRADTQYLSLDLRMAVGRRWMKLLAREFSAGRLASDYRAKYIDAYPVPVPDPTQESHSAVCAHLEAFQQGRAAGARVMDGLSFMEYIAGAGHGAFDGVRATVADEPKLAALADNLKAWYASLILQPSESEQNSWLPSRLEYQFGCEASAEESATVMRGEGYASGNLDWYALERRATNVPPREPPKPVRSVFTFVPASILFEGIPNTRWWALEDRRTNFGEVRPDTTDVGKLLFMEFALVYANDWFVLPYTLDVGTVAEAKGIALTNVFGERVWIEPVRQQPAASWEQWSLFSLTSEPGARRPPPAQLVLLPTAPKVQESAPLEEIALIRDEMANMVWGIERRIPLPSGATKPGVEAGRELFRFLQQPLREEADRLEARKGELEAIPEADRTQSEVDELADVAARLAQIRPPDPQAPIRYQAMTSVPENWIPFISVRVNGSPRQTQLQRAALPRILEGSPTAQPPKKIRPRTSLLREGLPGTYFVFEEEVPRAGAVVSHSYQRTRWTSGTVFTWLGARKQTGRGEGSSGLAFDQPKPMSEKK